ncbi:MAG TPA: hypothetical protein VFT58_05910, partial [Nitrososphaera sp.]|nr:hypothetical protein [Nitrososphaera sp.]
MVIAVLLLVAGLPVVIYLALSFKEEPSPAIDKAINQAQASTEEGDYADAYNKLKATENLTATKEQKVELFSSLAAAAANAGKPQEAIDYLLRKHQLDSSQAGSDAYMLASLYMQADDPVKAVAQ